MKQPNYLPVYQLTRGKTVESIHHGAVAVVNSKGDLIASYGDPQTVTFLRSTAKPFQAIPFVEQRGPKHFNLTQKELALICSSHNGTDDHAATATSIQAKIGIAESDLQCGLHAPYDKATREAMRARGEAITQNRHDCSGKHSGMLAFAKMNNWATENYLDRDHPVQEHILYAFSGMCGVAPEDVALGVDGCSAPNFAVPLYNAAFALARLADPARLHPERIAACNKITAAMTAHPEMVAGEGAWDTMVMRATNGRVVSKGGADGYQGMCILPGALGADSPALGIAIKVADGAARKGVRAAIALAVLMQLNALAPEVLSALEIFGPRVSVRNWRDLVVGEGSPIFDLTWHTGASGQGAMKS